MNISYCNELKNEVIDFRRNVLRCWGPNDDDDDDIPAEWTD